MAIPISGGVNQAAQIAQQTQPKPTQAPKTGESKFDQVMANKAGAAQATQGPQGVQATQAVQATQQATKAAEAGKVRGIKIDWARVEKTGLDPVTAKQESSKTLDSIQKFLGEVEKGQASMDNIIKLSTSSKKLSHQELLGMQAMVYRYSQELELTSKVVEKATSGLKDTLRTQV